MKYWLNKQEQAKVINVYYNNVRIHRLKYVTKEDRVKAHKWLNDFEKSIQQF